MFFENMNRNIREVSDNIQKSSYETRVAGEKISSSIEKVGKEKLDFLKQESEYKRRGLENYEEDIIKCLKRRYETSCDTGKSELRALLSIRNGEDKGLNEIVFFLKKIPTTTLEGYNNHFERNTHNTLNMLGKGFGSFRHIDKNKVKAYILNMKLIDDEKRTLGDEDIFDL